MPGKSSQRKGREGELELTRILQAYGYDAEPGRPQSYGEEPDIKGIPGVHIECKRTERFYPYDWIKQAERDSRRFKDGTPVVFFRKSREPWVVIMTLDSFMGFICGKIKRNIAPKKDEQR